MPALFPACAVRWVWWLRRRVAWWFGCLGVLIYGLVYLGWNFLWYGVNGVYPYRTLQVCTAGACAGVGACVCACACAGAGAGGAGAGVGAGAAVLL